MAQEAVSNVIHLPRHRDDAHLLNSEETKKMTQQVRMEFCEEITEMAFEQVMAVIHSYGSFSDPSRIKGEDCYMITEAIQAALFRYYNIPHPFHEISDNINVTDDEEGTEDL